MANRDDNEIVLPGSGSGKRKSADLLPRFFRTEANRKFLNATLDQLIQPGVAEKLNGYVGRTATKAFQAGDNYLSDVSKSREDYQLEPAMVIKDNLNNVEFYKDYNDYINQIRNFGGNVDNHSKLNSQESYSWNPNIDWDKFTNFREYYWLPNGPQPVPVRGQSREVQSTYTVTLQDNLGDEAYVFSPNGFTQNPKLKLYRGQTYRFEIDSPGHPIAFAISRTFTPGAAIITAGTEGVRGNGLYDGVLYGNEYDIGDFIVLPSGGSIEFEDDDNVSTLYPDGIRKLGEEGEEVATAYIEKGTIEFTIPLNAPDRLYYISKNDINVSGVINIYDIEENSAIDVEAEVLGKKDYKSANGVKLTNGMKIYFQGDVTPAEYDEHQWYVEGVGDKIKLVKDKDLTIPAAYTGDVLIPFDENPFDRLPYSNSSSFPIEKDYVVINRASQDGNAWTRYNRWFHIDVIKASARYNNQPTNVDQSARAKRPIIEFEPGLKLFNNGVISKQDVDVIDTFTKDVFSTIEGTIGYNVDGIDLAQDMRILFTADTDKLVKGKIYRVNFIEIGNQRQISLLETTDTDPQELETVLVTQGEINAGKTYYYQNGEWKLGQEKTQLNQSPLFDMFDTEQVPYNDETKYESSSFKGNKIFSYQQGEGVNDLELGFPLSYRNIENSGDILFDFNILSDMFEYQTIDGVFNISTSNGYLKKYRTRTEFDYVNGFSSVPTISSQKVINQYVVDDNELRTFEIINSERTGDLNDLKYYVYVNNNLKVEYLDYTVNRINGRAYVSFYNELVADDIVIIKSSTAESKVENNGYYEIAHNLERNPLNQDLTEFTLGEVIDHVSTIVENIGNYAYSYPGPGNLRDLGELDPYGTRFVKHSGPINLAGFHLTSKKYNIVNAMKYARREYSRFKRIFLQTANDLGYEGPVKQHVDLILAEIVKNKKNTEPFYFSDMAPFGPARRLEYEVLDANNPFYAITKAFTLDNLSSTALNVYLNGNQLLHNRDYTFDENFLLLTAGQKEGDLLEVYEYESTDGSYIPPTPTKLGLYPAYEPMIYLDDTYQEPTKVIQGHDGSIVVAFNDFRDELILEIERRIYNNVKQKYNTEIFDINSYVPSNDRNTGLSFQDIDNVLLSDFIQWLDLVDTDYTTNGYYDRTNQFTYNYSSMNGPDGQQLPGFWRGIYKRAYDTDRPHTHPWEMIGFSIKPKWWNDVYGPEPYTNNNLILWKDMQEGIVREPGKNIRRLPKYTRENLVNHIPVDNQGNLLSPQASNFSKNFVARNTRSKFVFGDQAPAETAWRRSSEYPFSLLNALVLNRPADIFARCFDISRTVRNFAGQLVYKDTNKPIVLTDIIFPNTIKDSSRTFTSGLINYTFNLIASNVLTVYDDYKNDIKSLRNQLGVKLAGFTDKKKFNLVLDSRSPTTSQQGGIFVPERNYKIFLNTSTAISLPNYSGVILTKVPGGFQVSGYDFDSPVFEYYSPIESARDITIVVGGVSEDFVEWTAEKQYFKDQIVREGTQFYRVNESFTADTVFNSENLSKISELPTIGGRRAQLRNLYNTRKIERINYGTTLRTIQEVVDFLQGYGKYLESLGFDFNYFNPDIEVVENWQFAVREYLFWTTQNFAEGTSISLSPSATRLSYQSENSVVDNIFDNFYDYSLLNANGEAVEAKFSSLYRDENNFGLAITNQEDGIYNVQLPTVQKEHVVLIDNRTEFNDVIYQPETGYRQDRIKIVGYRSDGWNGGLNIPGFLYDDAKIVDWQPNKDFPLGALVKYKEFYYVAVRKAPGTESFDTSKWQRLNEKPVEDLITNFDYRISQFADFYDLDSDNFDVEQQRLAQHLIGYQKRDYLANIINDDISQYKFYQGFIQDKGTLNALTKLFDALGADGEDSLEFYEEWAVQLAQFGAVDRLKEVEYTLDEKEFKISPQPIELTNDRPSASLDKVYRLPTSDVYNKPLEYNHKPFPTVDTVTQYIKTGGYVREEDVDFRVAKKDDLLNTNIDTIPIDSYIWVVDDAGNWDVLQHVDTQVRVVKFTTITEGADQIDGTPNAFIKIELDRYPTNVTGNVIGVKSLGAYRANAFFYISEIERNFIICEVSADIVIDPEINDAVLDNPLTFLRSVRGKDIAGVNRVVENELVDRQKVWVDDFRNGNFGVIQNQDIFEPKADIFNPSEYDSTDHKFASTISVSRDNRNMVVGSPNDDGGKVHIYRRTLENSDFTLQQTFEAPSDIQLIDATIELDTAITISSGSVIKGLTSKSTATVASSITSQTVLNAKNISDGFSPGETLVKVVAGVETTLGIIDDVSYSERKISFGQSVSISPDAEFIAVGVPDATEVKTRFKGNFNGNIAYQKNEVVRYRESLWKVNREILPAVGASNFSTFSSYAYVLEPENVDSTLVTLIVTGAPGLENQEVDHLLVRAPVEMYLGTKRGDQVSLTWNRFSVLHPTLDEYLPFGGTTTLSADDLTGNHIIVEKIDVVFYVDTFTVLPQPGDLVTTSTGATTVFKVIDQGDSCVIYGKDQNGVFDITDNLFINDEDFIGVYDQGPMFNAIDSTGGFWYLGYDEEVDPTPNIPTYTNGSFYYDTGRGLIFNDLLKAEELGSRVPDAYFNIQNIIQDIGEYTGQKLQGSQIGNLTYRGSQTADPGEIQESVANPQIRQTYPSDLWFIRASQDYTDTLSIGKQFELYAIEEGYSASDYGFDIDYIRGQHTVFDLWDGYIDFEFNNFDFDGFPFEPKPRYKFDYLTNNFVDTGTGDIIEDKQTAFNEFGGLSLTSTNTSSAEVMFYQRDFNRVRIFVKILNGNFDQLENIGRYELVRTANDTARPATGGDVNRDMGLVSDVNQDISLGTGDIGKLIIIQNSITFPVGDATVEGPQPLITDQEYWFFFSRITGGIARESNPPYAINKDYTQIYSITADPFGEPGPEKEGAVAIYKRLPNQEYVYDRTILSDIRGQFRYFGNSVQFGQDQNDFTLLVSSRGTGIDGNSGTIELIKHGIEELAFVGLWSSLDEYTRGDVVKNNGLFYRARKDIVPNSDDPDATDIANTTVWDNISWRYNKDENYRGTFSSTEPYRLGEIVLYDGNLYTARTNIAEDTAWDITNWTLIVDSIDYLGYLPNDASLDLFEESVWNPSQGIEQFAKSFDLSGDTETLIVVSKQKETVDEIDYETVLVYKKVNGKYVLSDQINEPNRGSRFGHSIAISDDGTLIAISDPTDSRRKLEQGIVYLFAKQSDGSFTLSQRIFSPNNEEAEAFGYTVAFDDNQLAVSSINGDIDIPTTFDSYKGKLENQKYINDPFSNPTDSQTTFDDTFTRFQKTTFNSGSVYLFEKIEDKLIYASKFVNDDPDLFLFGENIFLKSNHLYVGMPKQGNDVSQGKIIDYRKPANSTCWNIISQPVQPVDLDKIESIFLYNKKNNEFITYLDYIDPIQGKIAGPAEIELTYKLPFDPALYNVGVIEDMFSETNPWAEKHVGELWWDLSTARFTYAYQDDITSQRNNWNKLLPGFSIDVYEWVESDKTPSDWDDLVGTVTGQRLGITGNTLYGNSLYTQKIDYDPVSQTFGSKFYYWVRNTAVVPNVPNRKTSALNVANLIADPGAQGYRFVSLLGDNRFSLHNIESFINDKDIVIDFRFTEREQETNRVHTQYQVISEGLASSKPNKDIERKWFDSLIGYDTQRNLVPDPTLPPKQKYGNRNSPRQSMFVNKTEALKQVIERVNLILAEKLIVDDFDLSPLTDSQQIPTVFTRAYDNIIDTPEEFRFIGTSNIQTAEFTPVIQNGKIIRINITNPGFGYKDLTFNADTDTVRKGPPITISGTGTGAEAECTIDDKGRVISINVINQGKNYTQQGTTVETRKFTVLVNSDPEVYDKWALYTWNNISKEWFRQEVQQYDVNLFWDYADWYADGYNQFTALDFEIDYSYQLGGLGDPIGSIVRINDIGGQGWLLLRKVTSVDTEDYTVNYETIGRQNGTIQFLDSLYDLLKNAIGYSSRTFDSFFYDSQPILETRIILETIRDNILVDELEAEYNKLFFASLRYAYSEQNYIDWAFKTSFIKVKHNVGELRNDITFNNDNLPSYESYIEEVKPYKTTIREFISSYNKQEPTNTAVTDFDLAPDYVSSEGRIVSSKAVARDNVIQAENLNSEIYPRKFWKDNTGYSVTEIQIANPGSGYTYKPTVTIQGGGGSGAEAEAFLGNGSITNIKITNPGSGYLTRPQVIIQGSQTEQGIPATASVIIGDGLVRTATIKVKFDRISGTFFIVDLSETDTLTGTGDRTEFDLRFPMDLKRSNVKVSIDGKELLRSEYSFENKDDTTKTYKRQKGQLSFSTPPTLGSVITIEYLRPLESVTAQDRVNLGYRPTTGMAGNDLSQVMDGIDYGGVEVRSYDFGGPRGWDSDSWYSSSWDTFDQSFEDEIFTFDGSTTSIALNQPLESGVNYNVYLNGRRLDDINFDAGTPANPNAIIQTIVGDGVTQEIFLDELGIFVNSDDQLTIRKESSDGSLTPDRNSFDTQLSGGDLSYTTALGTRPEDIIVDGDGFVTPTTSKGPEELVPGQIVDTLDLTVYTRAGAGQGKIYTQSYITDGVTFEYDLGIIPANNESIIVKLDNEILSQDTYSIDYENNKIIFNSPNIPANLEFNIVAVGVGGQDLLDKGSAIADGETFDFITSVKFQEGMSAFVTIDGVQDKNIILIEAGDSYELEGNTLIRFESAPEENSVIRYSIFYSDDIINYSQISKDVFVGDGSTAQFNLAEEPLYKPLNAYNILVKVDNKILNAGYNRQFTIDSRREYQLETFQAEPTTIPTENIKVFINGVEQVVTQQWRFDIFNSSVVLFEETGSPGDILEVFVLQDGEYELDGKTITFYNTPADNSIIEIFRFTNHDITGIERISYDVVARSTLSEGTEEFTTYHRLTAGEVTLRDPAIDSQYVWVSLNGELLTPNIDYVVTPEKNKIQLVPTLEQNDVVDIVHFSAPATHQRFAFRQFKDMLNRTHYKRLDTAATELAQPLNYYDLRIEVVDGSKLPEPNKSDNIPGIIWIDGERIEYLIKQDNTLRQIRRGTLGTGTKDVYNAGEKIFDQGPSKNIPYQDEVLTETFVGDGTTFVFPLNWTPTSADEFEIFVAGKRLRKPSVANPFYKFNPTIALDSPEGDEIVDADYEVDGTTPYVTLTDTPDANTQILIVRKIGKLWNPEGTTLADTENDIARFLLAGQIDLPE